MFDDCTSLAELNAARIKAVNSGKDLITVNNAYNKRRQEIMSQRNDFKKLQPIFIKARTVTMFQGVPVCGRSTEPNTIVLTQGGFLY